MQVYIVEFVEQSHFTLCSSLLTPHSPQLTSLLTPHLSHPSLLTLHPHFLPSPPLPSPSHETRYFPADPYHIPVTSSPPPQLHKEVKYHNPCILRLPPDTATFQHLLGLFSFGFRMYDVIVTCNDVIIQHPQSVVCPWDTEHQQLGFVVHNYMALFWPPAIVGTHHF